LAAGEEGGAGRKKKVIRDLRREERERRVKCRNEKNGWASGSSVNDRGRKKLGAWDKAGRNPPSGEKGSRCMKMEFHWVFEEKCQKGSIEDK